jgi:hypothetical protein
MRRGVNVHRVGIAIPKNFVEMHRKTRFLKKAGFPDLSGKNFLHMA